MDPAGDTPGRLDIVETGHRHYLRDGKPTKLAHSLRTNERWRSRLLRGGSEIAFWFDVDRDRRSERVLTVRWAGGELRAEMRTAGGKLLGRPRVLRPDRFGVEVRFRKSLLRRSLQRYRWFATTQFHRPAHPECGITGDVVVHCPDRAPDRGKLLHRLE